MKPHLSGLLAAFLAILFSSGCATSDTSRIGEPSAVLTGKDLPKVQPFKYEVEGRRLPKPIVIVNPMYPHSLRMKRIQAVVEVEYIVELDGSATVSKLSGCPDVLFQDAIFEAVKQWRWEPGMKDGKPARYRMKMPITFSVQS